MTTGIRCAIFDTPLPIDDALPRLTAALRANHAAVLVAPPGAGKTTRVPLVLLDEPWAKDKKILVLEPRRLAARAAASRMASTLGEQVGDTVGLRVRFGSKISKRTRIEVITEGVFTRLVLDDPSLEGVAAVLFDEFHERSLDADLGLALARDVQQGLREDLKVLVMSATLDGARVAALLGNAPVVESEGRAFAVETRYLGRDPRAPIERQVADAVQRALRAETGSLLVFLPGAAEIRRTETRLKERIAEANVDIVTLYGALDAREQDRAISPSPNGPPQGGAGDLDRGNLAHHRRRARRHRQRSFARAALRARCRPDAAGNRAGVARRRRPAPRPRRPHRAGRLLPAVGRAADRFARALYAAGNSLRRSVVLRARSGAMGRGRSGQAGVSRFTAGACAQRGQERCSANSAPSTRLAASPRKAASCAQLPLPPRLARMVVDAGSEGAGELAAAIAAVLTERGLGGDDVDLRHRLDQFRRDRSRRAEDARAMVKRWVDTLAERGEARRRVARLAARARLSRPHRQEPRRRRRRLPARQWPRRHGRSGLGAGARAVPRGGRTDRRRGGQPHRAGGADHAGRDRGALCRQDRGTRSGDLRYRLGVAARAAQPSARRAGAGRADQAGRARCRHRAHSRARHCRTRPRPAALEQSRAAIPQSRACFCAGRKATSGPICRTRASRATPRNGWSRCCSTRPRAAKFPPTSCPTPSPRWCRGICAAGSTPRRRPISPRRPARMCRSTTRPSRGRRCRSACRNCSASASIRRSPAGACRW